MTTPFPFRWSDGALRETRAFLTEVLPSWTLREQRRAHRTRARRSYQFTIVATRPAHATQIDQLLAAGSMESIGCPAWPYASRLTAPASAGQPVLACDTTSRPFDVGQEVLLVRNPEQYEQRTIDAVAGSSITCGENLEAPWPQHTLVVPVHAGRLVDGVRVDRPTARVSRFEVMLEIDPLALPASAGIPGASPVTFAPLPDRGVGDTLTRPVIVVDPALAGVQDRTARRGEGRITQTYPLWLRTHAAVAEFWAWYDGVLGALTPSWVPSYQADVVPAAPVGPADTTILIEAMDYTARSFPLDARRRIALIPATGTVLERTITSSVDNLDGTETITLDVAAGGVITARHGLICFERLVCLDRDEVALDWGQSGHARTTLRFREEPYAVGAP